MARVTSGKARSEEAAVFKQGAVAHAPNPFTFEAEAGGLQVRGWPELQSKTPVYK